MNQEDLDRQNNMLHVLLTVIRDLNEYAKNATLEEDELPAMCAAADAILKLFEPDGLLQ